MAETPTTAAGRSGVRCPNPEPHEPHQYAIRADGITMAGGLCDPAQWPDRTENDEEWATRVSRETVQRWGADDAARNRAAERVAAHYEWPVGKARTVLDAVIEAYQKEARHG